MLSLPPELDTLCFSIFVRCDEFDSAELLCAVFTTTDLEPFADSLPPKTGNKRAFVTIVKSFLLEKYLTDGRVLLLPFLDTLRGRYPEQEALHGELNDLYQRVLAHKQPAAPPHLGPTKLELDYLRHVVTSADEFMGQEVYVDLAVQAASTKLSVEARSEAAQRVLERHLRVFKNREYGQKDNPFESESIDSFDELYSRVRKEKRVALIGDPGSGKTTTLMQLYRRLAISATAQPMEPLPVFVSLGDFPGGSFDDFLASYLRPHDLVLDDYLPDRIFMLLDGLNEMPVAQAVHLQNWLKDNPGVAVVVTCRKLDYFSFRLPMNRADIDPLDVERIHEFLMRYLPNNDADRLFWQLAGMETAEAWKWWQEARLWSGLTGAAPAEENTFAQFWHGKTDMANAWEREKLHLKRIQDALRSDGSLPGLLGIAANPFFLMTIVELYRWAGALYQNRGQLIAGFVDRLAAQAAEPTCSVSLITKPADAQRNALSVLAYQMQSERTGTVVDVAWAAKTLTTGMPNFDVEEMLCRFASANILDVVPGATVRFTHQLLQEYFAALKLGEAIRQGAKAQEYWPGENWWTPTGWEESVVLLAGLSKDATLLVKWLMPVQPTLAFRCATESGATCDSETLQALYDPPFGVRVSPEARFKWGKVLAIQGDMRSGVGLRSDGSPDIDWCVVLAGDFLFGRNRECRTLPAFRIARYPVTYMQFQTFVEAPDGYQNPAWWQTLPGSSHSVAEQEFRYGNHPRDNVSWYEAIAFCQWLSDKLAQVITLPTEQQWEKAARGTDGRNWPWGNKYRVGYANVDERDEHKSVGPTYLCSTTAVGMYPWGQSPYGVMDMCGNVWEWCLNDASDREGVGMGDPAAPKQLRGGSWNNNILVAPTYHRYSEGVSRPILPTYWNWRVGFRVVALD